MAGATTLINAAPVFSVSLKAPFLGTICQERLWIYSKEKRAFLVLSTSDGRLIHEFAHVAGEETLSATGLTCYRENLLVAFLKDKKSGTSELQIYEIDENVKLARVKTIKPPAKGRIHDLKCGTRGCAVLIQDALYTSQDLAHWKNVDIPSSKSILRNDVDLQANPFDGWSDKLLLSHGRYTKFLPLSSSNGFILLDPYRASLVTVRDKTVFKWGAWGVWEGGIFSPKAIALLPSGNVVISDTMLKALFVFDPDGRYLGTLSVQNHVLEPTFGINLISKDNRLYILDFMANNVLAVDVPNHLRPAEASLDPDQFVRTNLFRRSMVLRDRIRYRCLNCHDGSVTDELDKYMANKVTHPVNITYTKQTRLPLEGDNLMTCSTCHNAHHGTSISNGNEEVSTPVNPPFLKKDFRPLCWECHSDHATAGNNHSDPKGNNCVQCHHIHGGAEHLLTHPVDQLCARCHKDQKFNHRPVLDLAGTDRAKGIHLVDGRISCVTCHGPHGFDTRNKILREKSSLVPFCSSCHGAQGENLFLQAHKRMKRKGSP